MRWPNVASRGLTYPTPSAESAPGPSQPVSEPAISAEGLTDTARDRLAVALHTRWHGDCTGPGGKVECARRAGAYDDVAVLEPLILDLIRGAS